MTRPFPKSPAFLSGNRPQRIEFDIYDLEVEGRIPEELKGSWYRLGPDPQWPPMLGDDVYINGDGMTTVFRFEDGHVDVRARYVRTEKFRIERTARKSLYGLYRNPFTDDVSVRGRDRCTANTTPVWHGGRLLALKEDSHPYELDPVTLETKGRWNYEGKLKSRAMTAHPKIDPETGELWFFGYEAGGEASPEIAVCVADKNGNLTREEWFTAPYCAMVHDFAVTRNHVIFPIFPTTADIDRMKKGGPHWAWDGSKCTHVAIMPRDGSVKDIRWFEAPAAYGYHVVNAFEEGSKIQLDICLAQINPFPFIPDLTGVPYDFRKGGSFPTRWSFDLSKHDRQFEQAKLMPMVAEMPRMDERYRMNDYRYAYLGSIDFKRPPAKHLSGPVGGGFNVLLGVDVKSRQSRTYAFDDQSSMQEPQFIPKGPDAKEGDGYLIGVVNHHVDVCSDLFVFDAQNLEQGPVAKAHMPILLRPAFHSTWVPA